MHAELPYRIENLGFVTPRITADHFQLGGGMVPVENIRPDGQWLDCLPADEPQFHTGFETFGCTCFGTLNAREILRYAHLLSRFPEPTRPNYSDRFTYKMSGTKPPGNDPHIVAESIRNYGVISEELLPFSPGIDSLLAFNNFGSESDELIKYGVIPRLQLNEEEILRKAREAEKASLPGDLTTSKNE